MRLPIALLFAGALRAQTAGSVTVSANITATAGAIVCTGTASVSASASTMRLRCVDGADVVLPDTDFVVTAPGSTVYSVQRGGNIITWLLTKGNPTPDQWQVAANGVTKSGTF